MKILVTGASGMLGSQILHALSERGHAASSLNRTLFLKAGAMGRLAMLDGFDIVVHAAANTNVEQCEIKPEATYFDNCFLTEQLFRYARRQRVKFVFISSTGVYGRGKSTPYHEYDAVAPTTVHHRSKLIAEQMVLNCSDSLVIRTGWLFGGKTDSQKNFVANRLNEIRNAHGHITANIGQVGSPTYAQDCADMILNLIEDCCDGIYNVVNGGSASRFDYVKLIAELSGASIEVRQLDSTGFKRHADVSENEAAVSYRMNFEGRTPLRPWQEALIDYMRNAGLLSCLST